MGVEMFLVPAVGSSREIGCRSTPMVWVDSLTVEFNVKRGKHLSPRPEPGLETILLATGESVESASASVEIFTVRAASANLSSATLVVVEFHVTVRRLGQSTNTLVSYQPSHMEEGNTRPVWDLSSGMVQLGRVCNEIEFCSAS